MENPSKCSNFSKFPWNYKVSIYFCKVKYVNRESYSQDGVNCALFLL